MLIVSYLFRFMRDVVSTYDIGSKVLILKIFATIFSLIYI